MALVNLALICVNAVGLQSLFAASLQQSYRHAVKCHRAVYLKKEIHALLIRAPAWAFWPNCLITFTHHVFFRAQATEGHQARRGGKLGTTLLSVVGSPPRFFLCFEWDYC